MADENKCHNYGCHEPGTKRVRSSEKEYLRIKVEAVAGRWSKVADLASSSMFDYQSGRTEAFRDQVYVLQCQARDELLTGTHRE